MWKSWVVTTRVPERPRRATSSDVARLAGVSRATVSYVLNDVPHQTIPEVTRRRVMEAAAALSYRASPAARALRTGRSDVVLGVLPAVRYSHMYATFFAELGIALGRRGRTLVVHPLDPGTLPLREVWRTLTPDAVLAFGPLGDEDVTAMRAAGIQVALALSPVAPRGPWEVGIGDQSIGHAQAEHLLGLGHRCLGLALPADPRVEAVSGGRVEALHSRATAAGGGSSLRSLDPEDPDAALAAWLADEPDMTAVAAWNDEVAFALVAAAARLGVAVPERLAVIGAYDHAVGRMSRPTLSTVRVDVAARVEPIAAALVAAVEGAPLHLDPPGTDTLEVVRRGST